MPGGTAGRWTNEEHDLFIAGLNACGKGAWKAIADEFVKTRNAEQVRIHAQKYYARQGKAQAKAECKETAAPGALSSVKEGHWTEEEHELFLKAWAKYGKSWKKISEILKTRTNEQIRTHAQKYFQKLNELKCWGFSGAYAMDGTRHLTKGFMSEQVTKGVVETQALPPVKAEKVRTRYSRGSSEGSSDSPCGSVQGDPNMPFPLGDGLGGPYVMAAAPLLQEQPQQHMHPPAYHHHLLPSPIPMPDIPPPAPPATGPMMAHVSHILVGVGDAGGGVGMVMNGDTGGTMQASQGHVQLSTAHVPLPNPPPILMPPPMHSQILHHPHPLHPTPTQPLHTPTHAMHTPINGVRSPRPLKLTTGGNKPVYVTRTGRVVSRRRKTEDELYFDDDDEEEGHGELGDGLGSERRGGIGAMVMVNGEVVPGYGEYERKTPGVLIAQAAHGEAEGDAASLLQQQHQAEHTSPPPPMSHSFDLHQPHHEHNLQPPPPGCIMGVAAGVPMDSPQWVDMTSHFDDASRKRAAADGVIDNGDDHIHHRAHKVMRADDALPLPLQHIHHEHMAHMHVHHHNGEEAVVGAALTSPPRIVPGYCPEQPHLPPSPLDYHRSHSLPLSEMHIEGHTHDVHEYHHLAHPHDDVHHHHGGHGKAQGVHVHVHGGGHHHGHEEDDDVLHHHELMQLHHELDDHDAHEHHHHHHHDPSHHAHHHNLHALSQHHTADAHHEEPHHAYVRQAPLEHHRVVVPAESLHLECHEVSPSVEHASIRSPDMGAAIDDGSSTHSLAISSGGVEDVGLHVPGMMKMEDTGDGGQGVAGDDGAENSLAGPDVHVDGEGSEGYILSLGSGLVSHGDE